jgi:hypothetical protein
MSLPLDAASRAAKREEIRQMFLRGAEVSARRHQLSGKCLDNSPFDPPRHAGELEGCRNDGSGCLCERHDEQGGAG